MTYQPHHSEDATLKPVAACEHRYLTSYGKGWVCANKACGVGILSLAVPLPIPLVEEALRAIAGAPVSGVSRPAGETFSRETLMGESKPK